jgi:hypothetical protein
MFQSLTEAAQKRQTNVTTVFYDRKHFVLDIKENDCVRKTYTFPIERPTKIPAPTSVNTFKSNFAAKILFYHSRD